MNNWLETSNLWWDATAFSFADSFIAVATWILMGLVLVTVFDHLTKNRFTRWVEKAGPFQPFIAAIFGAIPGCGTALLLVPMYEQKKIRSGTLLALIISTSGDAAFILLALSPAAWGWITLISFGVAIVSAYIVDYTPIGKKMDLKFQKGSKYKESIERRSCVIEQPHVHSSLKTTGHKIFDFTDSRIVAPIMYGMLLITIPLSIMRVSGVDLINNVALDNYDAFISNMWVVGGIAIIGWYPVRHYLIIHFEKKHHEETTHCALCNAKNELDSTYQEIYGQLIFIMAWVVLANFTYNMIEVAVGAEAIKDFFASGAGITAVLIGLLAGFIPGCGPTIVMANLFTGGVISPAAMMTTAIAQDGDVAMPLLAGSKLAFFTFKLLSLIPAFIVGIIMVFTM